MGSGISPTVTFVARAHVLVEELARDEFARAETRRAWWKPWTWGRRGRQEIVRRLAEVAALLEEALADMGVRRPEV